MGEESGQQCGILCRISKPSLPQFSKDEKGLLQWIFACIALWCASFSVTYTIPFLTQPNFTYLNSTLYEINPIPVKHQPFADLVWIKIVYHVGFAASQFSIGYFTQYYGSLKLLKFTIKALIIFGLASAAARECSNF